MERDTSTYYSETYLSNFNSHAHVERDLVTLGFALHTIHFNSHAHVERDHKIVTIYCGTIISTHTLTWSVTGIYSKFKTLGAISTHTLTWSVT